ncbi:MAG TPA: zf-HC2 domain-containing protein, partial [Planctomicrobium sp.]|nr:zf-HC2 domain-containing protein [Planctomicrobium sp.]
MLNPTPDELLSAYLDGELSPSETASLEQRLSTDSSLREQLQELRELSQTLRQLPRSNAPAELHQSVMETIHRLPPITTTTSGAAKSSTKGFSLLRRRWWTGVISAGLLLCLLSSLLITPREWHPLAVSLHEKEANIQSKESPEWNLQESPALAANKDTGMASAEMASATLMVAPASSPITPPTAPTPSIAASGTVSSLGLGEQEQQTVAELPVPVVTMTNEEIRRKIESLQRAPAVGNSIQVPARMVESTGETPIVVVFTVVDVHQAMNQMQVLLQKQQVRTLDNKPVALLIGDSDKQSNSLQAD